MIPFCLSLTKKKYLFISALLIVSFSLQSVGPLLAAEEAPLLTNSFPILGKLQRGDALFDQLSTDISQYYQSRARRTDLPTLTLMRYMVLPTDSLFSISARLNLAHSTLATLNHLSNPSQLRTGAEIIIPNLPGIYLSTKPRTTIEQLLTTRLKTRMEQAEHLRFQTSAGIEDFLFFPSEDFSPQERLAFLGSLFRAPLDSYRISSGFGPRKNPFSGLWVQHEGLDLVAPLGTSVKAASDGTIIETSHDTVYGNFMIIDHGNGYETVYGHLLRFVGKKGQVVRSGEEIAKLGISGQSTGPHVHFEIHYNGVAKDPAAYLRRNN